MTDKVETWAEIKDDSDAIVRCGERWKDVASVVGCQLHGFDDGRRASFLTPDGNIIEVGPKFRAALTALQDKVRRLEDLPRLLELQRTAAPDCDHDDGWNAGLNRAVEVTLAALTHSSEEGEG